MKKRKRSKTSEDPKAPDAPILTATDFKRFEVACQAWSSSSTARDRIEYCRNRLSHYLPQQMPPLVDDILSFVFYERKPWTPWQPFDSKILLGEGTVDNSEPSSSKLSLNHGRYTGFTNVTSLLDGPRKWSCRIIHKDDVPGYVFVAAGIYNDKDHKTQKNLIRRDCAWVYSIHLETCNSLLPHFANQGKITSNITTRFDTVTIEVFPQHAGASLCDVDRSGQHLAQDLTLSASNQVSLLENRANLAQPRSNLLSKASNHVQLRMLGRSYDIHLENLADWRPYVSLCGNISVEVQEE